MRYCPRCGATTPSPSCPNDGTPTVRQVDQARKEIGEGDVIGGRYRVLGKLGQGGFGTVFDSVHVTTGHPVAVKVLSPLVLGESPELARRFFQEAATTSRLTHPNTVRVFDFGQTDSGELFLAMERLSGQTLQALISDLRGHGTTLAEDQTVEIGVAVLRSLGEAHALGLVHRDMKPANIFMHEMAGGEAIVKVLDFGIVKTHDTRMTQAGKALGTPTHMSPEQAMGHDVNGRSDLYSLGVVLYECLTGTLPFDAESPLAIVMRHLTEPVEPLERRAPGRVRPALAEVVEKVLAKRPDDRYQTAQDMRRALEEAMGAPSQTGVYRIPTPAVRPPPAQASSVPPTPIRATKVHPAGPLAAFTPAETPRVAGVALVRDGDDCDGPTLMQSTDELLALRDRRLRDGVAMFEIGGAIAAGDDDSAQGAKMPVAPRMDNRAPAGFAPSSLPMMGGMPPPPPLTALPGWGGGSAGVVTAGLPFGAPGAHFDVMAHLTRPLPMPNVAARRQVEALFLAADLQHAVYADPQHQVHTVDLGSVGAQPTSVLDLVDLVEVGGHDAPVEAVAASADGRLVASAAMDGVVRVWETAQGRLVGVLEPEGAPSCLAIAADAKLIVVGCGDGSVALYELPGLELRRLLRGHREAVTAVACTGSRRLVVSASEDGMVRTWDPVGGGARMTQRAHDGAVASVAVNQAASVVASGGWDGKVHVWYARTGETALDLKVHDDIVVCVAVDRLGNHVATGGDDRCARVLAVPSGEVRAERRDFRTGVKVIRCAEDANAAVAGAWDGSFRRLTW